MKNLIYFSSTVLLLTACGSNNEVQTKTVSVNTEKPGKRVAERKTQAKDSAPQKPAEADIPMRERPRPFLPPIVTDEPPYLEELRVEWDGEQNQVGWEEDNVVPPPLQEPAIKAAEPEIYEIVDEQAEFTGGRAAMNKYFAENMHYPQNAIEKDIQGKVYLKFVVRKDGSIDNVKFMRKLADCPECDEEAIRLVNGMPEWIPAKVNGKTVDSYFNLPVNFKLN